MFAPLGRLMCGEARRSRDAMAELPSPSDALRASLQALLEQVPILRSAAVDIVLGPHRDLILKARAQGHTYRAIAEALREVGMKVSPQTIRRYALRIGGTPSKRRSRFASIQRTREN
jgi:hypothetical protein